MENKKEEQIVKDAQSATTIKVAESKPSAKKKITKVSKPSSIRTAKNRSEASVMQSMQIDDAGKLIAGLKKSQIDTYDELESYKKLVKKRKKRLFFRIFTFLMLLVIMPIVIFFGTIIIDKNGKHDFFGLTYYIVVSNSMEPQIHVNDCVVLKKVKNISDLKVGDDIGYINQQGKVVVHKIVDIIIENGISKFVTAGINNPSNDQMYVTNENIVGKRISTLHTLGNAIVFFRSPGGIILLIALFASIVGGFYFAFKLSEDIRYVEQIENL